MGLTSFDWHLVTNMHTHRHTHTHMQPFITRFPFKTPSWGYKYIVIWILRPKERFKLDKRYVSLFNDSLKIPEYETLHENYRTVVLQPKKREAKGTWKFQKKSKSSSSAPATNNIYAMEKFQSEAFQKNRQYIEIGSVYLNFNAFKRFDLLFFSFSIGQVILSGVMIGIGSSNDRWVRY